MNSLSIGCEPESSTLKECCVRLCKYIQYDELCFRHGNYIQFNEVSVNGSDEESSYLREVRSSCY